MKLHDIFQIVCREKFLILMAWLRQQTRFMQEPSEQCFATFLFLRERILHHQIISNSKFRHAAKSLVSSQAHVFQVC